MRLEGRSDVGPWRLLTARTPYCEPTVPHQVLVALRLRPLTRHGGVSTCAKSSRATNDPIDRAS
jgi:hypothetical protein